MSTQPAPPVIQSAPPGYRLLWYQLEEVLGQSSQGITYLCHDLVFKNSVVLKEYAPVRFVQRTADGKLLLRSESSRSEFNRGLERFLSAAEKLDGLSHPNVTGVIDLFEANNTGYVVMNYAEGEDLQTILARDPVLDQTEPRRILEPILDGVEKLHQRGIVHSRIRSEHIVVGKDQSGVLLDLFSTRGALADPESSQALVGKRRALGFGIDIYDLGRLIYAAIGASLPADPMLDGTGHYEPLPKRAKRRYSKVLEAIDRALASIPEARPATIRELRRELGVEQLIILRSPIPEPSSAELPRLEEIAAEPKGAAMKTIAVDPPPADELFTDAGRDVVGQSVGIALGSDRRESHRALCPRGQPIRLLHRKRLALGMVTGIGMVAYLSGFWNGPHWEQIGSTQISESQSRPAAESIGTAAAISAKVPIPYIGQRQSGIGRAEDSGVTGRSQAGTSGGETPLNLDRRQGNDPPHVKDDRAERPVRGPLPLIETQEETLVARRTVHIETLLRRAAEDIRALRLTRPRSQSALEKYREVFALDPDNEHAARGMQAIVNTYVEFAYKNIRSNRLDDADRYLDRAASIAQKSIIIGSARQALAAKRKARLAVRTRPVRPAGRDELHENNSTVPVRLDKNGQPKPSQFEEFLTRIGER